MKSRDYWRRRFEAIEAMENETAEQYLATVGVEFRKASARVQREIEAWYQRFAANNKITMLEARRMLAGRDLTEFKWNVDEYIKYGEQNSISGEWTKQLENASARVHISRLEALQLEMQHQIEVLYGNQIDGMDRLARHIYSDGYYHTAFEVQKGFNVGWNLQSINDRQLSRVLSKPWTTDGKTFSDRIWTQKKQLVGTVRAELTQAIVRGDSPKRAIKAISDQFNVSKNKAARLVMTESAYFASDAQKDCYKVLNIEKTQVVETLDSATCDTCGELDGTIIDMRDYEAGVTAPPFHPWCRGCTAPYFDDNYGERIARGADGKTYYVPSDMKYIDWKEKFIG